MGNRHKVFAVVDLETTGLDIINDRIIEIAIKLIRLKPELEVIGEYESLVHPGDDCFVNGQWKPEYQRAFEVHNITPAELELRGQSIASVKSDLTMLWKHKISLLSDNPYFDHGFLKHRWGSGWFDTVFLYNPFDVKVLFYLNGYALRYKREKTHRAMDDVNAIIAGLEQVL